MTNQRQRTRILEGAMADMWPVAARVVDVTNAERFPNIKAAVDHVASQTPEYRAQLQAKWEN